MTTDPQADELLAHYQRLQRYVGWTDADAERIRPLGPLLAPVFPELVADFYAAVQSEPETARVITGGDAQIERLKGTLTHWLADLLSGNYDREYVLRRWRAGRKHVEIGLNQVYTNVALSRLRSGLLRATVQRVSGEAIDLRLTVRSLSQLIDLDLAIIEAAYQAEHLRRQQNSERLVVLGQAAGGIAHELRNPLNVIRTSVYYLLNAPALTPEKAREHLERIERQVVSADGVIVALSDFAKLPRPEFKPLSVADCFSKAVSQSMPPDSIAIDIVCPPDLPRLVGDERQLLIVFSNLVRNAIDAMPQGGRLTLSAVERDGWLELSFADTGVGIKPEHLPRITEPMFSTKARGMGIGLSLARAILDKHGGEMSVTSEVGVGATFVVRLRRSVV